MRTASSEFFEDADSSWNPKLQREAQMKNNGGKMLNFLKPQKESLVKFGGKFRD